MAILLPGYVQLKPSLVISAARYVDLATWLLGQVDGPKLREAGGRPGDSQEVFVVIFCFG